MTYLLSIDPGMSTGITLGTFEPTTPYERLGFWQVEGGLAGFKDWFDYHISNINGTLWWGDDEDDREHTRDYALVCEKFTPRPSMTRSFKLNELEPIRIEGALEMVLGGIVWQRPAAMILSEEGVTATMTAKQRTAKRKQASDNVLRRMGLWTTGKQVGCKDANDVNSAQKHAVSYLRSIGHLPTVQALLANPTLDH